MFQNISFTFLCALAFVSWSVLFYLHVVEEQKKSDDYNIEIYTERSNFGAVPQYCPTKATPTIFFSRAYDLLLNYGLILATTIALSKLLQFVESEALSYMQIQATDSFETDPSQSKNNSKLPHEVMPIKLVKSVDMTPLHFKDNCELRMQLDDLQARCQELLHELRAVQSSSTGLTSCTETDQECFSSNSSINESEISVSSDCVEFSNSSSGMILWKKPVDQKSSVLSVPSICAPEISNISLAQNLYVTHSHIHINFNGSVKLSQENINVGTLRLKHMPKSSEFRQVWGKYLNGPNEIPMLTGINNILM